MNYLKLMLAVIFFLLVKKDVVAQDKILPKTITVAQDGSGNYKTIQEAVNSVRDLGQERVKIYIKKGTYHEKLVIPSWKTAISLIGEDAANTIITHNDYSGKPIQGPGKDLFGNEKFVTYTTFTVLVQGNDFVAENLTIENSSGKIGQAVALHVEADRCVIKNCRVLGNQDTLYAAGENTRQYFQDCYIEGTVDFIFGEATAVFQNCIIKSLSDSYVTAASTRPGQRFGFVFFNCKLTSDASAQKVYLGRPWRPFAKTVFIKSDLGPHILPAGWDPWTGDVMFPEKTKTAYYAEFGNTGNGATIKERVKWSRQLTAKEADGYTVEKILGGYDHWNPLGVK
ncbi:pectinesterase [Dyadobacter frigoris]|uniref:pectinesterase family protein n=1 Tax=Dyadobacter frigoris TaxID=2576211 RepID=UPI0024A56B85|nr:pectinesterase family protein [Dyadobacter frigoris]GLU55394.1 pectinesterase [Dyadobacter frigoris]